MFMLTISHLKTSLRTANNSCDTAQRFGVDIQSGWAFLLSFVNLDANPCLPAARMSPLFMYLAYILPRKLQFIIPEKQDRFHLSILASTFLEKKNPPKPNLTPKFHKITIFPIINKINLPDKAKVPEKKTS